LIDCGEGTQMQLRKNRIRFSRINHIFISHIHGDHVFGLYGLISSMNLTGRKAPLHIYAPAGYGEKMITHLADFDIVTTFELRFIPLSAKDPVTILEEKFVRVVSFPLRHRVPSYGFLFREREAERKIRMEALDRYHIPVNQMKKVKSGADLVTGEGILVPNDEITIPPPKPLSYAYCSDTSPFPRLAGFVKDVDLLYHEATFDSARKELAHQTGHSTTADAAAAAIKAGAGTLLIGHFSARYRDVGPLVEEAAAIFPRAIAASEGLTIDVAACRKS